MDRRPPRSKLFPNTTLFRSLTEEEISLEGKRLPWGRLGQPAEIGKAATFLASAAAEYITGSVLAVDGCFRYKDCRSEF